MVREDTPDQRAMVEKVEMVDTVVAVVKAVPALAVPMGGIQPLEVMAESGG